MSNNKYRAQNVKSVNQEKLSEMVRDKEIIFGHDVAKESLYGVFMEKETGHIIKTIKWKHPIETNLTLELLMELPWATFEVAMESSGTYGDSFRYQLGLRGISVYRISAKHSHDGHEMYDGVPSAHDAKSSAVIADLHRWGKSSLWVEHEQDRKTLRAAVRLMDLYNETYYRYLNKLESLLARHWPEALVLFDLKSVSLSELLCTFGSAHEVHSHADEARTLLRKTGGNFLKSEKIDALLNSAGETLGVPPNAQERIMLQEVASEIRRCRKKAKKAKNHIKKMTKDNVEIQRMATVVGETTAAVLHASVGDSRKYSSSQALLKSMGLNLKEKSSGKHKGQLKITKRGSGVCRRYMYLAAMRLTQKDYLVGLWYKKKIERDGGLKMKALVAVMRKLVKALWHVNQGSEFCSTKLFDASKLITSNKMRTIFTSTQYSKPPKGGERR